MSRFGDEKITEPLKNILLMIPLLDMKPKDQKSFYNKEKEKIIGQYAYKIMHNSNYPLTKKTILLKEVAGDAWIKWFIRLTILCIKERIVKLLYLLC